MTWHFTVQRSKKQLKGCIEMVQTLPNCSVSNFACMPDKMNWSLAFWLKDRKAFYSLKWVYRLASYRHRALYQVLNLLLDHARMHGCRHASSQTKEGAAGCQTTKQAQQAGVGGQKYLPSKEWPGAPRNSPADWNETCQVSNEIFDIFLSVSGVPVAVVMKWMQQSLCWPPPNKS